MTTQIADLGISNYTGMSDVVAPSDELGKDEFLQLLVAQMSHQDPLEPTKNEEFVAQLATFSSLEQLQDINAGTQTGLLMQQSMSNALSTSMIGKDVLIDSSSVTVSGGESTDFVVDLAGEGALTVEITDADGSVVRTLEITGEDGAELAVGEHAFSWDGEDENGEAVADGSYGISVTAQDAAGEDVPVNTWLRGHVDGVRFSQGTAYVLVGDMEFTLADVIEIREALAETSSEDEDDVLQDVKPSLTALDAG